jgi:hypothetical protein
MQCLKVYLIKASSSFVLTKEKGLPLLSIFLASQASFSEKHASDIMTKRSLKKKKIYREW